jgi:signal transduction histidine kinase
MRKTTKTSICIFFFIFYSAIGISGNNAPKISQNNKIDSLLKYSTKRLINNGPFNHYNWIKIDLQNQSNQSEFIFEINQTYIDSLKVYLVKNEQIVKEFPKKGLYFSKHNKPSYFKNKYCYTYNLTIPKNDQLSIYINAIVNDGAFKVLNKIWTVEAYKLRENEIQYKTSYMIFFGGFVFLVLILSLVMFAFSKKVLYLYYAGFVFMIYLNLLVLRHFFSPLYLEKYLFFGNNFSEMIGLLQLFLMLQYVRYFFDLRLTYKRLDKLINYLALGSLIFFVIALFMRQYDWFYAFSFYFTKLFMVFNTVFIYVTVIYLAFKKRRMAYYFIIAYSPLFILVSHFILSAFGLTNAYNPLEWEFVIFFEIFVLTIAMAHNYYLMIKENMANIEKIYTQRIKISRDLHDNIGSQLTFIKSSIDNLKYLTKKTDIKLINKLNYISLFSSNTINQLRDTVWAINKKDISVLDLCNRIQTLIEKTKVASETMQFNLKCNIDDDIIFSSIKGVNIFRVIQESVNNALKYAEATSIDVNLNEGSDDSIIIIIKDNGKGFDINKIELGNGLSNMQRRIAEIDGKIFIESEINKGTNIQILVSK